MHVIWLLLLLSLLLLLQHYSYWSDEGDEVLGVSLRVSEDDIDHRVLLAVDDRVVSEHLAAGFERCFDVVLLADGVLAGQHPCLVNSLLSLGIRR